MIHCAKIATMKKKKRGYTRNKTINENKFNFTNYHLSKTGKLSIAVVNQWGIKKTEESYHKYLLSTSNESGSVSLTKDRATVPHFCDPLYSSREKIFSSTLS